MPPDLSYLTPALMGPRIPMLSIKETQDASLYRSLRKANGLLQCYAKWLLIGMAESIIIITKWILVRQEVGQWVRVY